MEEQFLIEGLRNRNKIVFDFVFTYYYSGLCAFANIYLNDKDASEDLVQDFFVHLWFESHSIRIMSSLKSYLFTAVKNRCLDLKKHNRTVEKYKKFVLKDTERTDNSTENFYAESELRSAIQSSLQKLTPRCREIFELSRINGLSNHEISEKLEITKRTVETQISNALKILRLELAEILPVCMIIWLLR